MNPAPPSEPAPKSAAESSTRSPSFKHEHPPIPTWLVRIELFLRVFLRMLIGIVLFFVPWVFAAWDQNPIFLRFPALGHIAAYGAVRGLVSGLGLLNLWIALMDAIRHRDG